jgi:hypothetical protein
LVFFFGCGAIIFWSGVWICCNCYGWRLEMLFDKIIDLYHWLFSPSHIFYVSS